jgi:hypothetical protein
MPPPGSRPARQGSPRGATGQRVVRGASAGGGGGPAAGMPAAAAADLDQLAARRRDEVQSGLAADRAAADAARERALTAWDGPEVSYVEHPEAFDDAYQEARGRRERGEDPVPYMTSDATDGLGARDGGRGFGVEIEFDFPPGTDSYAARAAIGRELRDAGLTPDALQHGYHQRGRDAIARRGHQGGWRFETDATVAGEIVSPIMYDEPETWRNLARVCEIVRRHGGIASPRTGGHVHVGLSDYDHTVENHNRLLQTVAGHEDALYRLAQNPAAAAHRGMTWCRPNSDPGRGYASISSARAANTGHSLGVNFESVAGSRSDHVEYRMWDGSLDPGVIQAHVNISLAMTAAGSRGGYTPPPADPVGTHQARNPGRRRLRGEQWRESTAGFRQLADTLFRRQANAAQAAALFAVTRWQSRR